jgi:hypothetical protein
MTKYEYFNFIYLFFTQLIFDFHFSYEELKRLLNFHLISYFQWVKIDLFFHLISSFFY